MAQREATRSGRQELESVMTAMRAGMVGEVNP
jgi:hypothetical protein